MDKESQNGRNGPNDHPGPATSHQDEEVVSDDDAWYLYAKVEFSDVLGVPDFIMDPKEITQQRRHPSKGYVKFTNDGTMIIKHSPNIGLEEAEAMDFVAKHTTVKVPKLLSAYRADDVTYIIMERVHGKFLDTFWATATDGDRETVLERLRTSLESMRSITADYIGGFSRTPSDFGEFDWDYDPQHRYGPWSNEAAWTDGLIEALERSFPPPRRTIDSENFQRWEMYRFYKTLRSLKGYRTVLTHGDLNVDNILVTEDLEVYILDWGTCGFYPEYVEWHKTIWLHVRPPSFIRIWEQVMKPYWVEADIMMRVFDMVVQNCDRITPERLRLAKANDAWGRDRTVTRLNIYAKRPVRGFFSKFCDLLALASG